MNEIEPRVTTRFGGRAEDRKRLLLASRYDGLRPPSREVGD
jgi:hypothetical protein